MQCIGGKVNNKLVPLSYQLKNGDQIEILTSGKQRPLEEWMSFVNTSKAKTRIKDYLREERKIHIEIGKSLVEKKFEEISWEISPVNLHKFCVLFEIPNINDLYFQVSNGLFDLVHVDKSLIETLLIEKESTLNKSLDEEVNEKVLKKDELLLIGEEVDRINYSLAKCCNPIAGDEVFGFVQEDGFIQIHRASCKKGIELMSRFGNKIVKTKWNAQEIAFLAGIKLSGTDRVGIVNEITKVISNELKVNMRSIMFDSEDGIFQGKIMVYVHDTRHLDTLINKLNKVNGIVSATRFD
jgi:GTP diphosphokinase / guanosine-3',5'-bis(diphosphate) 3'-diphosphatase